MAARSSPRGAAADATPPSVREQRVGPFPTGVCGPRRSFPSFRVSRFYHLPSHLLFPFHAFSPAPQSPAPAAFSSSTSARQNASLVRARSVSRGFLVFSLFPNRRTILRLIFLRFQFFVIASLMEREGERGRGQQEKFKPGCGWVGPLL